MTHSGPNAAAFDRLVAHETNPATWYPKPGAYLLWIRGIESKLVQGRRVAIHWYDHEGMDSAAWLREKRYALNRRINAKGGVIRYGRYNHPTEKYNHIGFERDKQRLRDIRNRIVVRQFETRAVRERFGALLYRDDYYSA